MVNDTRSKGCVRWGAIGPPPLQVAQRRLGAGARAPTAPTGCHRQGCRPPILSSSSPCILPLTQTCSQTLPLPLPPQARATAPRSPGSVLQSPSGLLHHTARVCTHSQPPGAPIVSLILPGAYSQSHPVRELPGVQCRACCTPLSSPWPGSVHVTCPQGPLACFWQGPSIDMGRLG